MSYVCAKRTSLTSKCDLNSQLHTFLYWGRSEIFRFWESVCGGGWGGGPKGFSPGNNLRDFNIKPTVQFITRYIIIETFGRSQWFMSGWACILTQL